MIIVTPRLVKPVRAMALKAPTDRVNPPNEADLLLLGRTDTGVPAAIAPFRNPYGAPAAPPPPPAAVVPPAPGGSAQREPIGLEKEYGHVL